MFPFTKKSSRPIGLASFFSEDDILVSRRECNRDEAVSAILNHLAAGHGLPASEAYRKEILARETICDTVVSDGVAIPHARIEKLQRPYVGVMVNRRGIVFAPDKPPVQLVFLLLIPPEQPALYLQILKSLSRALNGKETVEKVASLATPPEVMRFFEGDGVLLPEHLSAADIMSESFDVLNSRQSLRSVIDRFISQQASEFPVTDENGDMAGIVTARSLMKVLLPDYLLWLDDIRKLATFAPLAAALRNENKFWISSVLTEEFASVQMSAPAIAVASEMSRRNASICYVLNGKRLAGTISLPFFLNKLFRE